MRRIILLLSVVHAVVLHAQESFERCVMFEMRNQAPNVLPYAEKICREKTARSVASAAEEAKGECPKGEVPLANATINNFGDTTLPGLLKAKVGVTYVGSEAISSAVLRFKTKAQCGKNANEGTDIEFKNFDTSMIGKYSDRAFVEEGKIASSDFSKLESRFVWNVNDPNMYFSDFVTVAKGFPDSWHCVALVRACRSSSK